MRIMMMPSIDFPLFKYEGIGIKDVIYGRV